MSQYNLARDCAPGPVLAFAAGARTNQQGELHMSNWNMGSAPHHDGSRDVVIAFVNDDSNGSMSGTLTFMGRTFYINGNWAAAGSIPGRNFSAFALRGTDQQAATDRLEKITGELGEANSRIEKRVAALSDRGQPIVDGGPERPPG